MFPSFFVSLPTAVIEAVLEAVLEANPLKKRMEFFCPGRPVNIHLGGIKSNLYLLSQDFDQLIKQQFQSTTQGCFKFDISSLIPLSSSLSSNLAASVLWLEVSIMVTS